MARLACLLVRVAGYFWCHSVRVLAVLVASLRAICTPFTLLLRVGQHRPPAMGWIQLRSWHAFVKVARLRWWQVQSTCLLICLLM